MQQNTHRADPTGMEKATHLLERVREGQKVIDASGEDLGKVAFVKLGEPEAATTQGSVTASAGEVVAAPSSAMGDSSGRPLVAFPVGPADGEFDDNLAEPIRARLLLKGYFRIDGAILFGTSRYVAADQIASVAGDVVKLRVNKTDLAT